MDKERIIRSEATYFKNRHLRITTDVRAIQLFRLLKERLNDFYSPEYKAIFLDEIQLLVKESLIQHQNDKHDGDPNAKCWYDNLIEALLFYIDQEMNTLPTLARQKYSNNPQQVRDQVFVSYSRSDQSYLEEIKKHFKPFEDQINFWDNTKILPGQDWQAEIKAAIGKTKVIILLLSADFLASEFIASNELPSLLEAAEHEGAVILSVIIRPCLYEEIDELIKYYMMNQDNIPLLKMDDVEREELYVNLVKQTKRILTGK